jgi:hypothetical protein
MKDIVDKIIKACSGIFPNDIYFTNLTNTFILQGNSVAINNYNGRKDLVNVLYWFDNFYIYISINFIQQLVESKFKRDFDKNYYFNTLKENYLNLGENFYNILVSISVFQGGVECEDKKQLFRAEWDNYGDNKIHPQPHWHFYSEQKLKNGFDNEGEMDIDFLKDELQKEIDIKRVHFAMNGQWAEKGNHIHRINNQDAIINWFPGILSHIKDQLLQTKKITL